MTAIKRQRLLSIVLIVATLFTPLVGPLRAINAAEDTTVQVPTSYPEADAVEEEVVVEEVVPEVVEEQPEVQQPVETWSYDAASKTAVTNLNVEVGKTYIFPGNNAVSVTFTSLPTPSSKLTIKEIVLSDELVSQIGAVSHIAYDITTDMVDGTFSYDLSLPSTGGDVDVLYSEDAVNFNEINNYTNNSGSTVVVDELTHFTVFVVVSNPTPPPANTQEGIVDNGDADFSATGSGIGTSIAPCTNAAYLNDNHYGNAGSTALFTWTFNNIPQTGNYIVSAHWVGHSNRTTSAPYTINYEGGSTVVNVNQQTGSTTCSSSGFVTLGTYAFNQGGTYTITLSAAASGYVSADAVSLIFVENEATVVSVDSTTVDGTYIESDTINFDINFSEVVNVTGTPRLALNTGGYADYISGSGTDTLTFQYTVASGENTADLDYIATNSLELNGGTIQDGSTNDANLTLPTVGTFSTVHEILVDTQAPNVPSLVSPADGSYTTTAGLTSIDWTDETDPSAPVVYYYQSAYDATVGTNNGLTSPIYTSGILGTSEISTAGTPEGVYYYQFRACDNYAHCSDWSGPFVVTVDNTAPVITFNDNVEAGPVGTDTINVTVTDTNADTTSYEYGFSSDAICDGSDTYGNALTSGVDFSVSDESQNGDYICIKASDLSGNVSYLVSSNVLNIDDTAPVIGSVTVLTDYLSAYVRGDGTGFDIRMPATDVNGVVTCEYSLDGGTTWNPATYNTVPATDRCQAVDITAADSTVLVVIMRAIDTYGNEAIGTAIVRTADSLDPVVTAFTVSPNVSGYTTADPVLSWTITDNLTDINRCQYRYRITGSGGAGWSAFTDGTLIGTGTSVSCMETIAGLTDGVSYDFQVRGRDSVNHNSATSLITGIIVDDTIPSTVFTSPADNSFWNTAIPVNGTSTDNVGVDFVEVFYGDYDTATWTPLTTIDNATDNTPFNWTYSWTPSAEGMYDLMAIATDTTGNVETTAYALNVTYDVTAPAVPNPISPVDGYATQGVAFTQTWDNIADATLYRYQSCHVDPGDLGAICTNIRFTQTYASPSKFVVAGQPNGQFWWRVQARDAAGNWSAYGEAFEMIIDNNAPVVTLNAYTPDPTNNTTLNYTGSSDDTYLAGVDSVEYMVEDSLGNVIVSWTDANATDGTFDSDVENFDFSFGVSYDDTYTVSVRSTDRAGNVSTVVTDTVSVDTTAPVVSFDGFRDQADGTYDNTQTIKTCGSYNNTGFIAWEWTLTSTELFDVTYTYTITAGPTAVGYTVNTTDTHYNGGIPMEGTYTVEVYATDEAGNVGTAVSCVVIFDQTAPTPVTPEWGYDTPSLGYTTNSGTGLVRHAACGEVIANTDLWRGLWAESTDLNGIASYERDVAYNGSYVGTFSNTTNYTGTFNPFQGTGANGGEGIYHVRIRAIDNAGNKSIDDTTWADKTIDGTWCQMQIDLTAPIITANTTAANIGPVNGTITAVIEASDDARGDLNIQGLTATHGTVTPIDALDSETESFDWSFDTTTVVDGTYNVTFCAKDSAGNAGTGSSTTLPTVTGDECYTIEVIVDNTDPVATQLTDETFYEGDPMYTGFVVNATDANDVVELCLELATFGTGYICTGEIGSVFVDNEWDFSGALIDLIGLDTIDTEILYEGTYDFNYYVVDEAGNESVIYSVTYTIENVAPSVTLDADQTINEGEDATFTGSFTDPSTNEASIIDNDTYDDADWTATVDYGDGDVLNLGTFGTPGNITIPDHTYVAEGTYTVTLTVCENDLAPGEGECSTDTVTVTVENILPTVTITANPSLTINEGEDTTLTADISANTLPGNQIVGYAWSVDCSGAADSYNFVGTSNGSYTCTVTVTDADGDTATDTVTVIVNNVVPTVTIDASPSLSVVQGTNVTLTANISANTLPGNQIVSYSWSGACSGTSSTATLSGLPAGSYQCTVTVTDVDGDTANATVTVAIQAAPVTPVPPVVDLFPSVVIIATPSTSVSTGTTVTLQANILSGDANFSYVYSGSCSGSGTSTGGLVAPTIVPNTAGSYYCRIDITDADGDQAAAGVIISVNNTGNIQGVNTQNNSNTDEEAEEEEEVEEETEEEEEENEGNVLGAVCEQERTVSGRVYLDENENNTFDNDEEGLANVGIEIYFFNENNTRILHRTVETNVNGEWTEDLCPGDYEIELVTEDLADDVKVASEDDEVIDVVVTQSQDREDLDFVIVTIAGATSSFLWWGIGLLVLLILIILLLTRRSRREEV